MDKKSLLPRKSSQLAKFEGGLAARGLELIEQTHLNEVALDEAELLPFMRKFGEARNKIGDIPAEFKDGTAANPHDVEGFDLMKFLAAFDRIHICDGYVLDYVYAFDGHGGEPILYARQSSEMPLSSAEQYYERFSLPRPEMLLGEEPTQQDSLPYLPYLEFENTAMGCFQFAIFCMTVRRFYLYWHSNYNERGFILTKVGLHGFIGDRIGDLSPEEASLLESVQTNPRIQMRAQSSQVRLLSYERNLGYTYLHVHLRHPNILEKLEDEQIIKSHTEWLF